MNKQDFTIEGSIPLKKAFVEEIQNITTLNPWGENSDNLIFRDNYNIKIRENSYRGVEYKENLHFILPQDWQKAINYTREYFRKDPEFKVGDWVVWKNDSNNKPYKLLKITEDGFVVEFLPAPNCGVYDGKVEDNCRLATPEEIKSVQDKELLDKLIEESGFKVGDKIGTVGAPYIEGVIRKFHLDLYPTKEYGDMFLYAELEDGKRFVLQNWYKEPLFKLYPKSKTLVLGDKKIKVEISRKNIVADGKIMRVAELYRILGVMNTTTVLDGTSWNVSYPNIQIGCTTLSLDEVKLIKKTYEELND